MIGVPVLLSIISFYLKSKYPIDEKKMSALTKTIVFQNLKIKEIKDNVNFYLIKNPVYGNEQIQIIPKTEVEKNTMFVAEHFLNEDYLQKLSKGDFYEFIVKNEEVLTNTQLIKPGEYITVRVKPKGELNYALRHYSICGVEGLHNGELKFAIKLLVKNGKKGLVSHYLIDEIQLGDTLDISAPSGGDFSLNTDLISQNKYPIIFIE